MRGKVQASREHAESAETQASSKAGPLFLSKTESGFDPERISLLRNEMGQLQFSRLSLGAQNRVTLCHFGGDRHAWKGAFRRFQGGLKGRLFCGNVTGAD